MSKKNIEDCIYAVYSTKKGHENEIVSYKVEVKVQTGVGRKPLIEHIKLKDYKSKELAFIAARELRDSIKKKNENGEYLVTNITNTLSDDVYKIDHLFQESIKPGIHSEGTNIDHRKVYNKHIKKYENRDIRSITVSDIQQSISNAVPTCCLTSLKRIMTIWRSIYQAANNLGLDVKDITGKVIVSGREEVDDDPDDYEIVSDDNLEFFLETLMGYGQHTEAKDYERQVFYYMIIFGRVTGCRPSELTAWSKKHITLHEDERYADIHVCRAVGTTKNKKIALVTPKNKYSDRHVYVKDKYYDLLKEAIEFSKYDTLFTKFDGSLMGSTFVSNHINNINDKCKKLDKDFKFTLYGLRKTFATKMAESGVLPEVLMKMMGHNDIRTTYKYYVKVNQESVQSAFLNNNLMNNYPVIDNTLASKSGV